MVGGLVQFNMVRLVADRTRLAAEPRVATWTVRPFLLPLRRFRRGAGDGVRVGGPACLRDDGCAYRSTTTTDPADAFRSSSSPSVVAVLLLWIGIGGPRLKGPSGLERPANPVASDYTRTLTARQGFDQFV